MPLTKEFNQTVRARAQRDPEFRKALLGEVVETLMAGDMGFGKTLLRDYVNATIGFIALADKCDISEKSLMRMLSASGNPTAENLLTILRVLQKKEKVSYDAVPHERVATA
jgi:DNA-binding phage protein